MEESGIIEELEGIVDDINPASVERITEGATVVVAPLAGTIAVVKAAEGDEVDAGTLLLTLEAMKMEHRVIAPSAGVVGPARYDTCAR